MVSSTLVVSDRHVSARPPDPYATLRGRTNFMVRASRNQPNIEPKLASNTAWKGVCSRHPLDARPLEVECRTDRDGAVVTFAGTTRDHNEGADVLSLSYETYTEMAQKVMCGLFEEAVKRFPITRARVAHRLGEVPVGEASVLVVVASPHRGPAFDACRFLMDRLKDEVPIWKREKLRDGDGERWIGELPKQERS